MMILLLQESEAESAHSRLCREPDEGLHGLDCASSLSSTTLFACYLLLFPVFSCLVVKVTSDVRPMQNKSRECLHL
jgi:hypothetical protein